jgi:hypothetical protein
VLAILAQLILSGFMFLVGLFGKLQGDPLKLDMLPWANGPNAANWLVALGLMGIVSCVLAVLGRFRILFTLWCLFVLWQVINNLFLSNSYSFGSRDNFYNGLYLLAGAAVAFLVSLAMLRSGRKRDRLV